MNWMHFMLEDSGCHGTAFWMGPCLDFGALMRESF